MTQSSTTTRVQYAGDAVTTAFSTVFTFTANAHVVVIHTTAAGIETTWVEGTHYTIDAVAGTGVAGTVTVESGIPDYTPASGTTLTIKRVPPLTQLTDLPLGGAFQSSSVESMVDLAVEMVQALQEQINRAVLLIASSTETGHTMPALSGQTGKYVVINGTETGFSYQTPTSGSVIGTPVSIAQGGTAAATAAAAAVSLAIRPKVADYVSAETSLNNDAQLTFTHGLGAMPSKVELILRANTATAQGWADNEEMIFPMAYHGDDRGVNVTYDTTTIYVTQGVAINLLDHTSFNTEEITQTEYDWVVRAWL